MTVGVLVYNCVTLSLRNYEEARSKVLIKQEKGNIIDCDKEEL